MSAASKPTVLFLGATGGSTLSALTHTLQAGYPAIALVRDPSKLTSLLTSAGVPESTLNDLLTIHTGNALDVSAVKKALLIEDPTPRLPATIITGLGAAPKFQWSLFHPVTIDQPTLCGTAAATLVSALNELYSEYPALQANKPLLSFGSTTGITKGPEDVPYWMRWLYHIVLYYPHVDKRVREEVFVGAQGKEFRTVIGVRPTLLTDGEPVGLSKIRVGREQTPELGYTITRKDVGEWIFVNVVKGEGKGWEGEMVSMTS
jgi:hypothetical protein